MQTACISPVVERMLDRPARDTIGVVDGRMVGAVSAGPAIQRKLPSRGPDRNAVTLTVLSSECA